MEKNKLFLLGAIVFTLMLIGVYVSAATAGVSHPADEITAGNFQSGIYNFPTGIHTGINDTWIPYPGNNQNYLRGVINTNNAIVAEGVGTIRDAGGGWVRTYGNSGWYSQSYGGGWWMTDSTWMRSYNDKPVYSGSEIRSGTLLRAPYITAERNSADPSEFKVVNSGTTRISLASGRYGNEAIMSVPNNNLRLIVNSGLIIRDSNGEDNANLQVRIVHAGGSLGGAYTVGDDAVISDCNWADHMCVVGGQSGWAKGKVAASAYDIWSSEKFKKDISPFGADDYDRMLNTIKKTDVYSFQRIGGQDPQKEIGLIAERAPKEIVTENGIGISTSPYITYLFGGVKGLISKNEQQQKKIEDLEKRLENLEKNNSGKKQGFLDRIF